MEEPKITTMPLEEPFAVRLQKAQQEKRKETQGDVTFEEVGILPFVRVFRILKTDEEILEAKSTTTVPLAPETSEYYNGEINLPTLHSLGEAVDDTYSRQLPRWIPIEAYKHAMKYVQSVKEFFQQDRANNDNTRTLLLVDKPFCMSSWGGSINDSEGQYIKAGGYKDIIIFGQPVESVNDKRREEVTLSRTFRQHMHELGFKAVKEGMGWKLVPFVSKAGFSEDVYPSKTGKIRVSTLSSYLDVLAEEFTMARQKHKDISWSPQKITDHFRASYITEIMKLISLVGPKVKHKFWLPPKDIPTIEDCRGAHSNWHFRQKANAYFSLMLEAKAALPKMSKAIREGSYLEEEIKGRSKKWHSSDVQGKEWDQQHKDAVMKRWAEVKGEHNKNAKAFLKFLRKELKTFDAVKAREWLNESKKQRN